MNWQGIYFTFSNLFIFTLIYRFYYFILHNILIKTSNKYNTLSIYKQKYIVKNFIKSFILFTLVLKYNTILNLFNNNINLKTIQYNGAIYVANDFLGLLYIKNLPKSTKFHHLTTLLLLFVISIVDNDNILIYKLIYTYTIYSYHAFLVNLYLGLRYFECNNININNFINSVRIFAFYNYLICCFANLFTHFYIIYINYTQIDYTILLYSLCVIPIINDDIILLKWLKKKID